MVLIVVELINHYIPLFEFRSETPKRYTLTASFHSNIGAITNLSSIPIVKVPVSFRFCIFSRFWNGLDGWRYAASKWTHRLDDGTFGWLSFLRRSEYTYSYWRWDPVSKSNGISYFYLQYQLLIMNQKGRKSTKSSHFYFCYRS